MHRPGKVSFGLVVSLLLNAALAAGEVSALGRVQPAGGLIGVYGPPGDRVVRFDTPLGERVPAGAKLATLSGEGEREAQLIALDAQIEEAKALRAAILASKEAKLADVDAEANQAVVSAEQDAKALDAKIKAVDAQRDRALATQNRLKAAREAGVKVSAQEQEEVDALLAQATAEREATLAQQEKLKVVREEGKKSVAAKKATVEAETKRALAQVPLTTLEANQKAARQKLDSGRLLAPTAGSVVRFLGKPGDTVTTQPVLQLADTGRMVVIAEVYETDVGRVRGWLSGGKKVKAEVDMRGVSGDSAKLTGTVADVSKVATVVAKNVLTPLGPREDADRRVVEVEVDLDDPKAAKDYIGLQVRVTLKPQ